MTAPFFGFQLMLIGLVFAVLALLSGVIALPMTYFSPRRRGGLSRAQIGLVLALIVIFPIVFVASKSAAVPAD